LYNLTRSITQPQISMHTSAAGALAVLAILAGPAAAHSWIEQMMVISPSGTYTGNPGYSRNNTARAAPGFSDLLMVHILPGQGQPSIEQRDAPSKTDIQGILPSDPMCKRTQQTQFQSNGNPRLQAAAGDMVALRYEENGHVTLPQNQPGKPANRGNVYIYGTTQPKPDDKFLDIFGVWTADGTGGDKRGKLLATQPYDDGQCYQVNGGAISAQRQKQYPHLANKIMGTDLWCQNNIKIPTDAPSGKPYTLYWVWDWPTLPNVDPNLPKGKAEIYTTCMDVDITAKKASRDLEERQAPSGGDITNMAIPKYVKQMAAAPAAPAAAPVQSTQPSVAPPQRAAAPVAASPAAAPAASAPAAAPNAAHPATVTVTVGTPIPNAATQAPAAQAKPMASQAPAAQAAPPAAAKPPASLNIAAPVLSAPSAPPASLPTFPGTASNVVPSTMQTAPNSVKTQAAAVGARSCPANKCQQKRSKIFGDAAH